MTNQNELLIQLGDRIRTYRKQRGWTQETLAEYADSHPVYLGCVERGNKNPTFLFLHRLCRALSLPMEVLLQHMVQEATVPELPQKICRLVCELPPQDQQVFYNLALQIIRMIKTA